MALTHHQPLVFQGDSPQLRVSANLVTANLQMQVSKASPFLSHRSHAVGGMGSMKWRCPPHSALSVGAAGRWWHGKLQIRQGNSGQRRTQGVPKPERGASLPSDPLFPLQHTEGIPPCQGHCTAPTANGPAAAPAFAQVPHGPRWLPPPHPTQDRGACTPGSCHRCSRAQLNRCLELLQLRNVWMPEPARKKRNKHYHGNYFAFLKNTVIGKK